MDGALETSQAGILSSLQPQNIRLRRAILKLEDSIFNLLPLQDLQSNVDIYLPADLSIDFL